MVWRHPAPLARHLWNAASVVALAWTIATPIAARAQDGAQSPVSTGEHSSATSESDQTKPSASTTEVGEVLVTGTHIRGVKPIDSAMTTVSRQDIEQRGYLDASQILQQLPQNFGGGINPQALVSGGNYDYANTNNSFSSSPDLLGLGAGATLTLLNGHRLPSTGEGIAVDTSIIPSSMIERVDVLADGASAIYGADAVAGVVNIITRRSFSGGEARTSYGGADGGLGTFTASLLTGGSVGNFSGTLGLDYSKQGALTADERERSDKMLPFSTLVGAGDKKTIFGSAEYDISQNVRTHADLAYMNRSENYLTGASTISYRPVRIGEYTGDAGVDASFGGWALSLNGDYSWNHSDARIENVAKSGAISHSGIDNESGLYEVTANASGPVFELPAGLVNIAVGTQYRHEDLRSDIAGFSPVSRDVEAAFAEAQIPIVSERNQIPAINSLTVNIAGRAEHYSDFGGVLVPKIGLSWKPVNDLEFHAVYSNSFRAPSLYEMSARYALSDATVIDTNGQKVNALYETGTGEKLNPERAKNYTVGLDYRPSSIPGFHAEVDGYWINYRDRIATPDPNFAFETDIRSAPAELISRNLSPAQISSLAAGAYFIGTTFPLSSVVVVVDARARNLATTSISGVHTRLEYSALVGNGSFNLYVDGSYIANFQYQLLPTSPVIDRVGTIFSPPHFRSQSGLSWNGRRLGASVDWNYVEGYTDNRVLNAPVAVSAWNTIDASISYQVVGQRSGGPGVRAILSATNLFDTAPPYVNSTSVLAGNWDATNSSIIGRFVRLELVGRW